jgi:acetyltransferase-like isoleucine patch superfamily enzyme
MSSSSSVKGNAERRLLDELKSNSRPDRSVAALAFRRLLGRLRTFLYFSFRCRYALRHGFVRIPWSVTIWAPNKIVEFGNRVQFGPHCTIQCDIRFGSDVLIAGNVAFVGRNDHAIDIVGKTIWESPRGIVQQTTIEDDVWIGFGAIILSGVVIGRGAVVAAGAVVNSDVERYSIVAGVPARKVAARFTTEEIVRHERLVGIR